MLLAQLADAMQVEFEIASDIEVQKNTITVVFSTYDWKDKAQTAVLGSIEKTLQYYFKPDNPYIISVVFEDADGNTLE